MSDDLPVERITLWADDAVVLYDWLMETDLDTVPITHPAQKQALADLLSRLEQDTHIEGVTQAQITRSQEAVARSMGW